MQPADALVYAEPVAISARPFRTQERVERWYAELTYAGRVFDVPGTYADEAEALRGADAYRASWEVPSERTLAYMERRANGGVDPEAWRRRSYGPTWRGRVGT